MQQRVTPKSLIAENKQRAFSVKNLFGTNEEIIVGYETTSKLFFRSIHWAIPISVTNSPRVRSKITP